MRRLSWKQRQKFKKLLIHKTRKINRHTIKCHNIHLKLSRCVFAIKVIFLAGKMYKNFRNDETIIRVKAHVGYRARLYRFLINSFTIQFPQKGQTPIKPSYTVKRFVLSRCKWNFFAKKIWSINQTYPRGTLTRDSSEYLLFFSYPFYGFSEFVSHNFHPKGKKKIWILFSGTLALFISITAHCTIQLFRVTKIA